jgi:hypothetical protein
VARSHRRTVWSGLALARVLPSGLNATEVTGPEGPVRGRLICRPLDRSHNRTAPSALPVARVPSGLSATEVARLGSLIRGPPLVHELLDRAHDPTVPSA